MISIAEAIRSLGYQGAFAVDEEGNMDSIVWGDSQHPTNEEIQTKITELEASYDINLLRIQRDSLLRETDWVSGEDVPQALKDTWFPYRQALRDITNTYTSLDEVVWPTKP